MREGHSDAAQQIYRLIPLRIGLNISTAKGNFVLPVPERLPMEGWYAGACTRMHMVLVLSEFWRVRLAITEN